MNTKLIHLSFLLMSLLFIAATCEQTKSSSDYGPFIVSSIYDVRVGDILCETPDQEIEVSFKATGAIVCTNEKNCGSDYLRIFEYDFDVPLVPYDLESEFSYKCGFDFEGRLYGIGSEGQQVDMGILSVGKYDDGKCILYADTTNTPYVSDLKLIISKRNSGVLLGHEDYAPEIVETEVDVSCL